MLFSLPRYDFHFNHCCFIFSGIGWSHWKLSWHNSWIGFLPFNKNSDTSPKGSYIELNMANNPLLVKGLSIIFMLKQRVSLSVFYKTPRALSSGTFPVNRSWSFTPAFLSSSGIEDSTSGWWLINLVSLKPPAVHIWKTFLISDTASSAPFVDFKKSSKYKFHNRVFAASWQKLSLLSVAAFFNAQFEQLEDEVPRNICVHIW